MVEFFDRKMKNLFTRFDLDGSGSIDENDFNQWSDKLISYGNLEAAKADELRKNIKSIWTDHFAAADKNGDGNVSMDEFVAHIKESLLDEAKRTALKEVLPLIYDAVDSNKDGSISREEFANYYKSLNVNDVEAANSAFQAMDVNNDGSLSKEEFISFGKDFFMSGDEANGSKHFFGPLN